MPAEWELHEATWLTWPTNRTTWPGKLLKRVENIYIQMIAALLPGEKVNLLVRDTKAAKAVSNRLNGRKYPLSRLIFHQVKTVDTWIRDYGPIFVKKTSVISRPSAEISHKAEISRFTRDDNDSNVAFTKWIFNAWGGKYSDLARDNRVVDRIPYLKKFKRFDTGLVMEGGSIDMNGLGTCLTTEQCLLTKTRNPKFSKKYIEDIFGKYLGVKKMIWLKEGIEGDDTDGHVDDITRFVGPRTVVTAVEDDPKDMNHKILEENLQILKRSTDQDGKRLRIFELPMPGRVGEGRHDGCHFEPRRMTGREIFLFPPKADQSQAEKAEISHFVRDDKVGRLPASYANFYIGNKSVLLPIYSNRNDRQALSVIKGLFPKRKVVSIECSPLVYGLGSIHCVTQQQPA